MSLTTVQSIVEKHKNRQGGLIAILEEIQSIYSYLPEDALKLVAELTGKSLVDVYGVATFYKSFSLQPRGKHVCSVCVGTACHVRGSQAVSSEFGRQLGIAPGETSADRQFSLETVACLGACAQGPITVVNGHYFANVSKPKVASIIHQAKAGLDRMEVKTDERIFPIKVACPSCNHSIMDSTYELDGHPSIKVTTAFGRKHGWLRLSCLYGSYTVEYEHEIPTDAEVNFFCPHCHAELNSALPCADCDSPLVPMIVRQGGMLQVCSRKGCRYHMLDLNGSVGM